MLQINQIHCLDVRKGLKQLPDESVDCVVTSPPYWALRDYGKSASAIWDATRPCKHVWAVSARLKRTSRRSTARVWNHQKRVGDFVNKSSFCTKCGAWRGQFGLEPNFDLYLQHLIAIFDDVQRVLKKTGTLWVNLGDTYAGSWGSYAPNRPDRKPSKDSSTWYRRAYGNTSFRPPSSFKQRVRERSLCMIPSRFAVAMTDRKWILRNEIIWHKPNGMPSSAKSRFTVDFDKLFFFTKNRRYHFETQHELGATSGSKPASRRIKRCVWSVATRPFPEAHFAVFPEQLIETPIRAGCPPGGLVLDPFMGSGTTAIVAQKLGRNFLGFEVNCNYVKLARRRLAREIRKAKKEVGS